MFYSNIPLFYQVPNLLIQQTPWDNWDVGRSGSGLEEFIFRHACEVSVMLLALDNLKLANVRKLNLKLALDL